MTNKGLIIYRSISDFLKQYLEPTISKNILSDFFEVNPAGFSIYSKLEPTTLSDISIKIYSYNFNVIRISSSGSIMYPDFLN